jgi:hypothetical protein
MKFSVETNNSYNGYSSVAVSSKPLVGETLYVSLAGKIFAALMTDA